MTKPKPCVPPSIDEAIVQNLMRGQIPRNEPLTTADKQEAIKRMTARGDSIRQIAERLGLDKRTVVRYRGTSYQHRDVVR